VLPSLPKTPGREAVRLPDNIDTTEFSNSAEEAKFLRVKVKFLEKNLETMQSTNIHLEKEITRLEKDLERYQREERLREREEKLREREERLLSWEKDYQARSKLPAAANGVHVEEVLFLHFCLLSCSAPTISTNSFMCRIPVYTNCHHLSQWMNKLRLCMIR
jgi:hypothetical protein